MHTPMLTTPSRKEYILQQKRGHNRLSVAVLPVHYPKEILTALDILSVEIWGPPGFTSGAGASRVQAYICSIARNAMSFIEAGKADVVDGLVFPHTCDSLQGLATLMPDWGSWKKPVFRFQHPRGPERAEARSYLKSELQAFISALEKAFDRVMSADRLARALALHGEADGLKRELFAKRRYYPGSDIELYRMLRQGEFLWIEDEIAGLKRAVDSLSTAPVQEGIPLLVSGYVPEPMAVIETLYSAGGLIVADDYAAIGRRIAAIPDSATAQTDPLEQVVTRYLSYPPCPTRSHDTSARIAYLLSRARESGAKGVLMHEIKFCEPAFFDVPLIKKAFETQGVPVLLLESELEKTVSSQTSTRIEAFIEMLKGKSK
jgi:benzoyl-CoA reductase/2-hydroxyglutaryl-CoA dehydratase subunit BcrC/BadD/HgdB